MPPCLDPRLRKTGYSTLHGPHLLGLQEVKQASVRRLISPFRRHCSSQTLRRPGHSRAQRRACERASTNTRVHGCLRQGENIKFKVIKREGFLESNDAKGGEHQRPVVSWTMDTFILEHFTSEHVVCRVTSNTGALVVHAPDGACLSKQAHSAHWRDIRILGCTSRF